MKVKDEVEKEYERAILRACQYDDNEAAYELSIGLRQYREMFKVGEPR